MEEGVVAKQEENLQQMEAELISKKEVLKRTGISYGQFYRWKRKGLIPESWFVRKSTFTGQETFLPQGKVLARIARILELKDEHSLDEIAGLLLLPTVIERGYTREEILGFDWLDKDLLDYYDELRGTPSGTPNGTPSGYGRTELIHLAALKDLQRKGLSQEEIELALLTLLRGGEEPPDEGMLIIARKRLAGNLIIARTQPYISLVLICSSDCGGDCRFDPQTEVTVRLKLGELIEQIKIKG